jgi:hypothetical protein
MPESITFQLNSQKFSIEEINSSEDACFSQMMHIYEESFPPEERVSIKILIHRMNEKREQFFACKSMNTVVGIGFVAQFLTPSFSLIDYFAIVKKFQKQKIGSIFLRFILQLITSVNHEKFVILEVEDPAYGNKTKEKLRRIKFYQNCAFKLLQDVHFYIPDLSTLKNTTNSITKVSESPQMLKLMYFSHQNPFKFTRKSLSAILKTIYVAHYKINAHNPLIKSILKAMPHIIK